MASVRKVLPGLLILLLLSLLPLRSSWGGEREDFSIAFGLYQDGLYQLASQRFGRFFQDYPQSSRSPQALFYKGESEFLLGRFKEAIEDYEKLLVNYPAVDLRDTAGLRMGECKFRLDDYQGAAFWLRDFLSQYPQTPLRGKAYYG